MEGPFLIYMIMMVSDLKGHAAMIGAETMWGLMAPVGKLVMAGTVISPLLMTDCRMIGAACLFWIASFFTKPEHVNHKDMLSLFFAALLGIVFNQGSYIFGLGLTSPINASIVTTSSPILTMIIAALYLREPVTGKKLLGVFMGAIGALMLILSGQSQTAGHASGNIGGDLLCLLAQLSFALYLVFFKGLISRYSPVTLMKWMFTYAAICMIPFSYRELIMADWGALDYQQLAGLAMVVFGATFISYLLIPIGQKNLRPTVTSMYNYLQPIVASIVAIFWGMDSFNLLKVIAVILVFSGVFFVTRSKSRAQMEAYQKDNLETDISEKR